jgi:hypothetical protein
MKLIQLVLLVFYLANIIVTRFSRRGVKILNTVCIHQDFGSQCASGLTCDKRPSKVFMCKGKVGYICSQDLECATGLRCSRQRRCEVFIRNIFTD